MSNYIVVMDKYSGNIYVWGGVPVTGKVLYKALKEHWQIRYTREKGDLSVMYGKPAFILGLLQTLGNDLYTKYNLYMPYSKVSMLKRMRRIAPETLVYIKLRKYTGSETINEDIDETE